MYEAHFHLTRRPFGKTPDPAFLYPSRQHAEALARLEYAVEERDFALLTGEIGCGKTTLSRALVDRLGETHEVVLFINPILSPTQLLRAISQKVGVPPAVSRNECLERLNAYLFQLFEADRSLVLMIDEAQLIPGKATFDTIRLLTNYQLDDTNLLSVVVVGQPEVQRRLKHPAYAALRQRIGITYHLSGLSLEETEAYLQFRLERAGAAATLFNGNSVEIIHQHSRGVPRLINNIANTCLISAFEREEPKVSAAIAREVVEELQLQLT